MAKKFAINDTFIKEWHPKYDEHDEGEYGEIVLAVSKEVSGTNTISKPTFVRILNWKAARAKGYVRWKKFSIYEDAFRNVLKTSEENQKVATLDNLPGIGIPVASTILHFIYPQTFPIIDFRTVQVLQSAQYLDKSKSLYHLRDTIAGYSFFCRAMRNIRQRHPKWSLRQIDRALFAYHKKELEPKLKKMS